MQQFDLLGIGNAVVDVLYETDEEFIKNNQLEKGINPDISSIGESLWWCINTIMTVGFVQDIVLISIEGKVFSIILIISGLLLFGTFISFITDYFVKDKDLKDTVDSINSRMTVLEEKIDRLLEDKK